ncbi:MAG: helix-turn-helix transcriptional regulator [Leptolyngbya sp. SIO1E4]|nr:helix-turn-helix transcriptional regulator [Leptolyngbya sp. SIO1E4]
MPPEQKKDPQDNSLKPVKISAIDEDILTVLMSRELYGLEILDQLNLDRPVNELRFGSLYPALNRLEKKGLVAWKWGDEVDESGGARRKYYKVTGLGAKSLRAVQHYRAALADRVTQPQTMWGGT